eukprot:TRINITY_DN18731_c0_g1_i1.p1 TRINITY_DN18731_c0_g1~~TRINITY_DN18731_c0_g1_i1.p1  ORF type:complete len:502 (+),score=57.32 TRINITY_DN18731_c0_g1_i1:61-1566(+)
MTEAQPEVQQKMDTDESDGSDIGETEPRSPLHKLLPPPEEYDMLGHIKHIPLRLSTEERQRLQILLCALNVCEYTDKVDNARLYNRQTVINEELEDFYHIILGLQMAQDGELGKKLRAQGDTDLKELSDYFTDLFEIARRYKIMNPDHMRTEYGKLLYLLQDAASQGSRTHFGFVPYKPVVTVESKLIELGLQHAVQDPLVAEATRAIPPTASPAQLEEAKRHKESLLAALCKRYCADKSEFYDAFERCLRSIDDAACYARDNVCSLDVMLSYLHHWFQTPKDRTEDLTISYGRGGSFLSHNHLTQFTFVKQTLTLWKHVALHMFRLWHTVERDMLNSSSPYRFRYTGQGYNRVQSAPGIAGEMGAILRATQQSVGGSWVGLSVVHLGDDDVPNALNFIDKYTQVARIINPIVKCIEGIDDILKLPGIPEMITLNHHSPELLKKQILQDYFRHGFDGSGDDGGSCIDGRLTSNWNWCSKLNSKPYAYVFSLTGFSSFDGQF